MTESFTPTLSGDGTQVADYPNRFPEQQIVYDRDSDVSERHWTVEDAAIAISDDVSDRAVQVAQEYLGLTQNDIDESEGGHAD